MPSPDDSRSAAPPEGVERKMHGWSFREERGWSLHVGGLPGRKSFCLYEQDGSIIRPLAYFRSEREAQRALWAIDRLLDGPTAVPYEPYGDSS